jgi:hypothetical protein
MVAQKNRQWLIADRPIRRPIKQTDFTLKDVAVGTPDENQLLVRQLTLGFDPSQKGRMENVANYAKPTEVGEVMGGSGVGQVIATKSPKFAVGDIVSGQMPWEEYPVVAAGAVNKIPEGAPPTAALGVLGGTGLTAYFGLLHVGKPVPGDTLVVSGAAGATGSVVGQIGKIAGCRVIGIAGGQEKCDWLTGELGFDDAIDYKNDNVRGRLKDLCRNSINVMYDNVGGPILNDCLGEIAREARIVICGGISRYEAEQLPPGPPNYFNIVFRSATMQGFLMTDYMAQVPVAHRRLTEWIADGRIKYKEDVQQGFENAPKTLMRLFAGKNFGKQLLHVADPE